MVGALSFFTDSQNRPHTYPRHPRFHRGLAEFDASRLVLASQSLTLKAIRLPRDP
jgi:hypothetical protein